jgi:hypothetical protein
MGRLGKSLIDAAALNAEFEKLLLLQARATIVD